MRIFSIADIHGEFEKLVTLISLLKDHHNLDLTQDMIVFTGDYIDRGKRSLEVLELVYKLNTEFPSNVIALAGNHEWMMLDYYMNQEEWPGLWRSNGGNNTIRSFYKRFGSKRCPQYLLQWLRNLPLSYETDKFFFSHAPQFSEEHRDEENKGKPFTKEELIWDYSGNYVRNSRTFSDKIGVCGHIHELRSNIYDVRITENYVYGDAGCGCDKDAPLCAVNLDTMQVIYSI